MYVVVFDSSHLAFRRGRQYWRGEKSRSVFHVVNDHFTFDGCLFIYLKYVTTIALQNIHIIICFSRGRWTSWHTCSYENYIHTSNILYKYSYYIIQLYIMLKIFTNTIYKHSYKHIEIQSYIHTQLLYYITVYRREWLGKSLEIQ